MPRALLITTLSLVLALAAAPAASADSRSFTDPSGDLFGGQPIGNSPGSLDIVRGTYGHSRGRLVHTVTTAGSVGNPATSTNFPTMFIEHPKVANGMAECAYFVGRHNGRLGIFRCGYGSYVTGARITRTSSRTVRFEFSLRGLGNPARYRWALRTRSRTQYSSSVWTDRLPSGEEGYLEHVLR